MILGFMGLFALGLTIIKCSGLRVLHGKGSEGYAFVCLLHRFRGLDCFRSCEEQAQPLNGCMTCTAQLLCIPFQARRNPEPSVGSCLKKVTWLRLT